MISKIILFLKHNLHQVSGKMRVFFQSKCVFISYYSSLLQDMEFVRKNELEIV
ncbi:hypothetical protein CEAn_00625 [Coxiella endosymbiont of Amblyomma nuttalli]|nr:hypothetical protein CEAn_00625 [Coxiella endosymbiont of Amblyomma nuttalli]